jgi:hypothetical protein
VRIDEYRLWRHALQDGLSKAGVATKFEPPAHPRNVGPDISYSEVTVKHTTSIKPLRRLILKVEPQAAAQVRAALEKWQ